MFFFLSYCVCVLDLNSKSDLIVGAPFYYDGSRSTEGAVYIYYNTGKGIQSKYDVRLTGKQDSRFGWSLADLGDINKDGFNDLAIGAPYDEGGGAVYIYLGSSNGIKANPVQIIRGSDIRFYDRAGRSLQTFGYSLSGKYHPFLSPSLTPLQNHQSHPNKHTHTHKLTKWY